MSERVVERIEVDNLSPDEWRTIAERCPQEVREQYPKVDDCIRQALERQVWPDDLTKQEAVWSDSDDVPQFVKTFVSFVLDETNVLHDSFDGIPAAAGRKIHDLFEEKLTQPQGWSLRSIQQDLMKEFPEMPEKQAETITRMEVGAVLNEAREIAYESREDEREYVFDWTGPNDSRNTKICEEIRNEVESRGGAVPMDELKDILYEKARKYRDRGGTPDRADNWMPHYGCRHTLTRRVQT